MIGVDSSEAMLSGAQEYCNQWDQIRFIKGDALHTELPTESVALVLERALIHHLEALEACLKRFLDPMVRTKASWLNIAL